MNSGVSQKELKQTMREVFGLETFRPGQEEVINAILSGRDTLAIMPTGSGKSLCYQLPGLHLTGTTVIVSPLISLMKDQSDKLTVARHRRAAGQQRPAEETRAKIRSISSKTAPTSCSRRRNA